MAKCNYCRRSSLLLRTNSHGLCKKCREEIRSNAEADREKIKEDLISARFLKDSDKKVHYLQSALNGTKKLFKYERLGFPQPNPSPKALKAFLEKKLREETAVQQLAKTKYAGTVPRATADEQAAAWGPSLLSGTRSDFGSRGPRADEDGGVPSPGTRCVRRHTATFKVRMDRTTPALTEDISSRGFCVRSASFSKPGTRVSVLLEAPGGQVSGEGTVRWAQRKETDKDGSSQAIMGVEFLAPPPELQMYS